MELVEEMLKVSYPACLMNVLRVGYNCLTPESMIREMRVLSLVKLYEEGKISSGLGAEILGISRVEFIDLLRRHGVYFIDMTRDELESDLAAADTAVRNAAGREQAGAH